MVRIIIVGCRLKHRVYPCKIRTGILAGSRRDLGGNPAGMPARFWPPGFFSQRESPLDPGKILAGKRNSQRPKSRRDPAVNLAKILARKLAKILAGKQKSRWPKSRWDPASNLASILAEKQKSRRPKSQRDPVANLTKILAGKQ